VLPLLVALFSPPAAASVAPAAAPTTWQNQGPSGGPIADVAVSATSPPTLWASTQYRNFLSPHPGQTSTSQDGGKTWSLVPGLATLPVGALAADPAAPNVLLAGADLSIYRTEDGGQTWTAVAQTAWVNDLAFDPSDDQIAYAAVQSEGIFKTTDNGRSWVNVDVGDRQAVAVDPADGDHVYAGSDKGAYVSSDGGARWTLSNAGFPKPKEPIYALTVDPAGSGTVYAGTADGFFISTDHGATWTTAGDGIGSRSVSTIAVSPSDPQLLYAGVGHDVMVSDDGATTWADASAGLPGFKVGALGLDPTDDQHVWAGTGVGMFETTNGGARWQDRSAGLANAAVISAAAPSTNAKRLYAGAREPQGVTRTDDRGRTWRPVGKALSDYVYAMAVDPTNADVAYAVVDSGQPDHIEKTIDGGRTWTLLPGSPFLSARLLAVSDTVLYGAAATQVFASTDAGATWQEIDAGLPGAFVQDLASNPSNPQVLYAALQSQGVWKTQDGGATWSPTGGGILAAQHVTVAVDPSRPRDVYVATDRLYRSTNGGGSWSLLSMDGCAVSGQAIHVVVDPIHRGTIYVDEGGAVYDGGGAHICQSTDGGNTWSDLPSIAPNNPGEVVLALLVSSDGSTLYAVPWGAGLYSIRVH
jgi:photosystem II stability/assembly factor-like uncharacterized protein